VVLAVSLAVSPWAFTPPVSAVRSTLYAVADARVEGANPTRNFGSSSTLGADASPAEETYLRFSVPAGTGPVLKATLLLRVDNSTDNGPEVRATSTGWNESTITWSNRPAPVGGVVADAGKLSTGSWVSYDVSALVKGPGTVAFHLKPESSDGVDFPSREAAKNRPQILVETGVVGGDGSTESTFSPVEDAHGDEAKPDQNFGSGTTLYTQGGSDPDMATYLRFQAGGLTGVVQKATLRLFVTNDTADGPSVQLTGGNWTESGLTWRNRPAPTGPVTANLGKVAKGWVDLDVTPAVTGSGTVNFVLLSTSSDSFGAGSSEASSGERPQLVVQTVAAPTSTTTTSTTTTSTTTTSTTTTSTTSTTTTSTTLPPTTTTSSTTTSTLPPPPPGQPVAEPGEPWLGLARLVTNDCAPECVESTYSLSVDDVAPTDTGDQRNAFRYPPGGAAVLRLEWARSSPAAGCGTPGPTTMEVFLRTPSGGNILGRTKWDASIPGTCSGEQARTIHFDTDPMDGDDDDADYYGVMELFGRLTGGGDSDGADTRGARPADPADDPGRYARGHLVSGGVMVGWHEDGDDPVLLAANERALGEPFGLVRSYESDWELPSMRVRNWMAEGKFVLWSVKPPADAAGYDDWTPVALGTEDEMLRAQVNQLQTWAAAYDVQVGFIFNHEPHDDTDIPGRTDPCEISGNRAFPCSGTSFEFIDVYQRLRTIIDTMGADRVKLVYTATLSWAVDLAPGSNVLGSGDPMTQGLEGESVISYVDLIAHDSYNWYCFRASCDWEYPDEFGAWGRGVELAETQGKQIIMAETASHPGCPDPTPSPTFKCENRKPSDTGPSRDDWLIRIGTWLESDHQARQWIAGFAYFHSLHTNDWRFVGQTGLNASGVTGWRSVFVNDSAYNDALGGHDYFTQYGFNNL
jgi:hypothetical protein